MRNLYYKENSVEDIISELEKKKNGISSLDNTYHEEDDCLPF